LKNPANGNKTIKIKTPEKLINESFYLIPIPLFNGEGYG